jgi:hypothetical protein
LLTAVVETLVSAFCAVMVTPGSTAPCASLTVPVIDPSSLCADAEAAAQMINSVSALTRAIVPAIVVLLREEDMHRPGRGNRLPRMAAAFRAANRAGG